MFTAIIVACHIANANACIQFIDNRGPYDTEDKCNARVEEMLSVIMIAHVEKKSPYLPRQILCFYDNLSSV